MERKAYLSDRSNERLASCDPDLIRVIRLVEQRAPFDFTVLEGRRSRERQKELFDQGFSRIDGVNRLGKHNYDPSEAVDIAPFPVSWKPEDHWRFDVLAGVVFACAAELGVKIRWGGDWDQDGDRSDHTFLDLPHFEVIHD